MAKLWKKYLQAKSQIEVWKKYSLKDALELVMKVTYTKFPSSIDLSVSTSADPKYNDQAVRSTTVLPNGTWKTVKIAAFVSDDQVDMVKKLWVVEAWNQDLLKKLESWDINFDILVTTTEMMKDLARVAKILWPKWLMPSPKAGTVSNDIAATIEEIKKWRVEFRTDKTGNIAVSVGKSTFSIEQLEQNINSFMSALEQAKPTGVKGKLVRKVVVSSTMSPWVQVEY